MSENELTNMTIDEVIEFGLSEGRKAKAEQERNLTRRFAFDDLCSGKITLEKFQEVMEDINAMYSQTLTSD
jgi:hypothetical protein